MRVLRPLAAVLLTATTLASLPAMAATTAAENEEIALLKAQLKAMTARLDALEKTNQAAKAAPVGGMSFQNPASVATATTPATPAATSVAPQVASGAPAAPAVPGQGQPVVGGVLPNSFKLPGSDTTIKIGGYAKLDAAYDTNGHGSQYANFAAIPLDGTASGERNGAFNMHARQSRINLETRTPTGLGELKTFVEMDFFGSARGNANTTNGEGMMLRQAYGQVGKVLAGQTWSNFMDLDAYPESLDYIGPAGLTFVRQAQVRYTDTLSPKTTYAFAVESPIADYLPDGTPTGETNASDAPDLTAKLQYKDTFGHLALRGVARQISAATTAAPGTEDSAFGWGLGLSGKIATWEKDNLFFQGAYGDGIGHYLFDVAMSQNGSTYVNNQIETQTAYGGYLGYQHYWSPEWRSNLLAGYTGINNDVALTGAAVNEEVASGHVNLIWSPMPSYRVGVEYMHGYRKQESGTEGDLDRVQTSFMYLF